MVSKSSYEQDRKRMELKKSQMESLISKMTERNIWNAMIRWRMHAERGTKYFHYIPRRSTTHNVCKAMLPLGWHLFRLFVGICRANITSDAFGHADSDFVIRNAHFEIFLPAPARK